jgi:hypothetical protein
MIWQGSWWIAGVLFTGRQCHAAQVVNQGLACAVTFFEKKACK